VLSTTKRVKKGFHGARPVCRARSVPGQAEYTCGPREITATGVVPGCVVVSCVDSMVIG